MTFNSHCLTSHSIAQGWHSLKCVAMPTLCLCRDASWVKNALECLHSHGHCSSETGSPRYPCRIEMCVTSMQGFWCCMALHKFFTFGCPRAKASGVLMSWWWWVDSVAYPSFGPRCGCFIPTQSAKTLPLTKNFVPWLSIKPWEGAQCVHILYVGVMSE